MNKGAILTMAAAITTAVFSSEPATNIPAGRNISADTNVSASADAPVRWKMEHLCRIVKPMRNKPDGRLPLLLWNDPVPRNDQAVAWRQDGRLRKAIDDLWARGIALTPELGTGHNTTNAAWATALTLKEAGLPVHVLYHSGMKCAPYTHSPKIKGPSPWNEKGELTWTGEKLWPIFPLYDRGDISNSVAFYRQWMKSFKEAGIEVAAVWTDYEGLPGPYNFAYEAQKMDAARTNYPPGALDSETSFFQYVMELRVRILSEAIADPVHEIFPRALVGNYNESESSAAYPYVGGFGQVLPPGTIGRLNALMPAVYASTKALSRYYNLDWPINQSDVDNVFFVSLLRTVSSSLANKKPGQVAVPFVAPACVTGGGARYQMTMSTDFFRELLRHALLRGADSFYVYNEGYQDKPDIIMSPQRSFETVEATRQAYDEMLAYREFLDYGKPMNFEVPAMRTRGVVWSGLRLDDRCLVRAFCLGPAARSLDLVPFPGLVVTMEAPPEGATYLIARDGKIKKVGTGLIHEELR